MKQELLDILKNRRLILPKKEIHVLVAICVHRNVDVEAWECLMFLSRCLEPKMHVRFQYGDALIDRSRGIVASRFLEHPEYDVLLFLDDDIIYDPRKIVTMIQTMLENDLDICGAPYVKKQKEGTNFAIKLEEGQLVKFGKDGMIHQAKMISTGCMAIQKRVFKEMVDKEIVHFCNGGKFKFYPFFKPEEKFVDGQWNYLSEDWAFCHRAKELGFKVWVDMSQKLGHAGRYVYDWDDMLRRKVEHIESGKYWEKDWQSDFLKEE